MLSLYKLEIFATVARAGSFSAAADLLLMTQPAISQHIQDLESTLGTQFFRRGRRGVTLTPAGETLHVYTQQILRMVADAENAVTNVENLTSGQIDIGATPGVSVYSLPEWMGEFRRRFPQFTIGLYTDTTAQITTDVLSRKMDVGFVEGEIETMPASRLAHLTLATINQLIIVGAGHEWWDKSSVPITALQGQPFITRQQTSHTRLWMDDLLGAQGIDLKVVAEFDNPESIKQAVASGMGITILPETMVRHELETDRLRGIAIENFPMQRTLKLVWDSSTLFNPITRTFLTLLAERFPVITGIF